MKQFDFSKFMQDITKKEKPVNDIKEAPETPQEKLFRRHREHYLHRMRKKK